MKTMKKLLLIPTVLLSIISTNAQTWDIGEPVAANVTATLSNDTLYIRGIGNMQYIPSPSPWQGSGITHAVIEPGVTSIGNGAFLECTDLISIDITEDVTTIGVGAFQDCSALTSVVIPQNVTDIEAQLFNRCSSLTSVVIPDNVTSINSTAFTECSSLTSVTIPENVTYIGISAFMGCRALTSVEIPESVTYIGNGAFRDCTGLTSVTLSENITSIINRTFMGCTSLTSIIIPDNVTTIDFSAFSNCTALTSIIIPENVTTIGNSAFSNCTALTSVTIPDNVATVEASAFNGCSGLTSITIPENISLGDMTFASCNSLTSVVIPENVTMGEGLFYGCSNLISVTLPEDATSIPDQTFMQCYNLASVIIPENVTTIGSSAFFGCRALTSIEIPENVTTIGNYAFTGCTDIASITIPQNVTTIGNYIFSNCTSLVTVTNLSPIPQLINTLSSLPPVSNINLIVPCGSIVAYQQATGWQDFGTITEDCPQVGVSNVSAVFACPGGVTVNYDLNTTDPTDVTLYYSPDGGKTWLEAQTVTGDLTAQTSGNGKTIVWDNRTDRVSMGRFKLRVDVPKKLPCNGNVDAVEINGVCWATRNVDTPGTFVQNPEDYGMFYQWNSNIGWSLTGLAVSTDGSTWNSSWDGGGATTWETTNNVCPSGYRIPTRDEMESLLEVSSQWVTRNGINGFEFGSGSNTIFLPAAGVRYSNIAVGGVGSDGHYWNSHSNGTDVYYLFFGDDDGAYMYYNSFRARGISVRCVAE